MRAALSAADEFADSLMLRADTAEREMLSLVTNQEVLEAQVVRLASMRSAEDVEAGSNAETWSERSGDAGSEAGVGHISLQKTVSWSRGQQLQEQQELLLTLLRKRGQGGEVNNRQLLPWHWLSMGAAAGMGAAVAVVMALRRRHREDDPPMAPRIYPRRFGSERYGH